MDGQINWAEPTESRNDIVLVPDQLLPQNHLVRLLDEVLDLQDWSEWETLYRRARGQPPRHPKVLAKIILYGLMLGLRSSRRIEYCLQHHIDFIWLASGQPFDHSTICQFRTRHKKGLKALFLGVCKTAITLGLARIGDIAFDGTRTRANNNRYNSRTAESLKRRLARLDEQFQAALEQAAEVDAHDDDRFDQPNAPTELPEELADLKSRREKLTAALAQIEELDAQRKQHGLGPTQLPMADPDARIMPNKEGGFAPNYTPTATTEGEGGFILDCNVLDEVNEGEEVVESIARIEEHFGEPDRVLADKGMNDGPTIAAMEQRGTDYYTPVESEEMPPDHPAYRQDFTEPVPESEREKLPMRAGQLEKRCFAYDKQEDCYYCPMGERMEPSGQRRERNGKSTSTIYQPVASGCCAGCSLKDRCLGGTKQNDRTISRNEHAECRERMSQKMATAESKAIFDQRSRIAEQPFGRLKGAMGIRQFLLRGLAKVRQEWRWYCTSLNLRNLLSGIARLRAEGVLPHRI